MAGGCVVVCVMGPVWSGEIFYFGGVTGCEVFFACAFCGDIIPRVLSLSIFESY